MKQEDKDLLLKDLYARLPYGIKAVLKQTNCYDSINKVSEKDIYSFRTGRPLEEDYGQHDYYKVIVTDIKPYLFPMSSMTEEQKKEYYSLADDITIKPGHDCRLGIKIHCIKLGISDNPHEEVWDYIDLDALDWLNKNHFDYKGLIDKGLAIDATGLNIY